MHQQFQHDNVSAALNGSLQRFQSVRHKELHGRNFPSLLDLLASYNLLLLTADSVAKYFNSNDAQTPHQAAGNPTVQKYLHLVHEPQPQETFECNPRLFRLARQKHRQVRVSGERDAFSAKLGRSVTQLDQQRHGGEQSAVGAARSPVEDV